MPCYSRRETEMHKLNCSRPCGFPGQIPRDTVLAVGRAPAGDLHLLNSAADCPWTTVSLRGTRSYVPAPFALVAGANGWLMLECKGPTSLPQVRTCYGTICYRAPHRIRLRLDIPMPSLLPHSLQVLMSTSIKNHFHQNAISGSAPGEPSLRWKPSVPEPRKSTLPKLNQDNI